MKVYKEYDRVCFDLEGALVFSKLPIDLDDINPLGRIKNFTLMDISVIKEIKRLQKEIDEAEQEANNITLSTWGNNSGDEHLEDSSKYYAIITTNQSKIKQIIESL